MLEPSLRSSSLSRQIPLRGRYQRRDRSADLGERQDVSRRLSESIMDGRGALVVGEAGTGKTHLVSEALTRARAMGYAGRVVTVHGNAHEGEGILESVSPTLTSLSALAQEWRAEGGGAMLRVEDAHLLDPVSSRQLGWLMRQEELCVVATMRPSGATESPWFDLWRNGSAERIDVVGLSRGEVHAYLETRLGGPVGAEASWRIWEATAGRFDRLMPLINTLVAGGELFNLEGVWLWEGTARPDEQLLEIAQHDLRRLDEQARMVLEILSLLGAAPLGLLRDIAPTGAVEELQRRGLLVTGLERTAGGDYESVATPMHPMYAAAVRLGLSRRRREELLTLMTAEFMRPTTPVGLRLAYAGFAFDYGLPVDLDTVLALIEPGISISEPQLVLNVLNHGIRVVTDPAGLHGLLLKRAQAHWRLGDIAGLSADVQQAGGLIEAIEDPARRASALISTALLEALVDYQHRDDVPAALARIEAVGERLPAAAEEGRRLLTLMHVGLRLRSGDPDALAPALQLLTDEELAEHRLILVWPAVLTLAQRGDFSAALSLAAEFEDAMGSPTTLVPWAPLESDIGICLALLLSGEVEAAFGLAFHPLAAEQARHADHGLRQLADGVEAIATGAWSDAVAVFHTANVRYEVRDRSGFMAFSLAGEALARAAVGDRSRAADVLRRARAARLSTCVAIEPTLWLMWLDTVLWMGEPDAAAQARELADRAAARQLPRLELEACHRSLLVEVRAGQESGKERDRLLARIERLGAQVEGPRAGHVVAHARALAAGDEELALAAERALSRCGLWLPVAPPAGAGVLTRREREVAGLAAGGLSSKAIAERLVLSVRTVDSHLSRAFTKLGVHSREELARVMR